MANKFDSKLFGGILLVVGTAIGGGMLALPIATAEAGFVNSIFLMLACWFIMTSTALLVLEVNLWLPPNTNIISMAKTILGRWGEFVAWISYLLLFYSVLAAYMAGGGDFLHGLLHAIGLTLPNWLTILLFASILGYIVYRGIRYVDYVNRGLMISKFGVYLLLVVAIIPFVSATKLIDGNLAYVTAGLTVMITSFTFANIIPSLRTYFKEDTAKLRKAILIGSVIPLICYLLWDLVIMGVIPREGETGLISMLHSQHSTSAFVNELNHILQSSIITTLARIFTSICLATSFLASALGLSDFLADGFQVEKKGRSSILVYGATFLPPLIVVLFYPGAFVAALGYAGICCVILLALLPSLMAWRGRYGANPIAQGYRLGGGKPLLAILITLSSVVIIYGIWEILPKRLLNL